MSNNLVFIFETIECDWDSDKDVRGIFSDANEAVEYIRKNYYLLDGNKDVCIPNHPIKGYVFKQRGYDVHPNDVLEDGKGLYYWEEYYEDDIVERGREYLHTETLFTLRGVVLDGLLK